MRIDVESGNPTTYTIPATNPFVATPNARPEIWALGLRNPWSSSFDRVTGDYYIADVGNAMREEVDFQPADSPGGERPLDHLLNGGRIIGRLQVRRQAGERIGGQRRTGDACTVDDNPHVRLRRANTKLSRRGRLADSVSRQARNGGRGRL